MLIRRPVIVSAAHKDALRYRPTSRDRPDRRFRAATVCAARLRRRAQIGPIVVALSLVRPAWCAARDGQLWGWFGVCRAPI